MEKNNKYKIIKSQKNLTADQCVQFLIEMFGDRAEKLVIKDIVAQFPNEFEKAIEQCILLFGGESSEIFQ